MVNTKESILFVYGDKTIDEDEIQETIELIHACDMHVKKLFTQRLTSATFATYIGKGKVSEIQAYLEEEPCASVIFQQELTPLQLANLETILQTPVITRSDLIVEIFARRANSQEAKLQVESARLKKLLPRLIGTHASLGRQSGGQNKGSGEKQLEIDRRRTKAQVREIDKQLKALKGNREVQRRLRARSDLKQVALIGYTNSGKSTLLNALLSRSTKVSGAMVLEKDMVFATLDTAIRKVNNSGKDEFLLFDTVGFISKLPHVLVKAFHSTLEEACYADLLVQVIDASSPHAQMHSDVTMEAMHSIHADHIPILKVYNKCDKSEYAYPKMCNDGLYISANDQKSLDMLYEMIQIALFGEETLVKLVIPYEKGAILASILRDCSILTQENDADSTILEAKLNKYLLTKYANYVKFQ